MYPHPGFLRMIKILKFLFFNVIMGLTDVSSDLATFFTLVEDHRLWAILTASWMITPFLVHAFAFAIRYFSLILKFSTDSRLIGARCRKERLGYETHGELALGFYNDAVVHLPFVSSVHNLWRTKLLMDLNYGTEKFRMRDSAKVQEILVAAGKGSYSESMYEAGPQSVTQVSWMECMKGNILNHRWSSS